jgi:hypothetical protein
MKKKPDSDKFRFLTERSIKRDKLELTRYQSADLRKKLPQGIYWLQISRGGLVQWNWFLLHDYLLNGDSTEHQALVEEYLMTLPQSA